MHEAPYYRRNLKLNATGRSFATVVYKTISMNDDSMDLLVRGTHLPEVDCGGGWGRFFANGTNVMCISHILELESFPCWVGGLSVCLGIPKRRICKVCKIHTNREDGRIQSVYSLETIAEPSLGQDHFAVGSP